MITTISTKEIIQGTNRLYARRGKKITKNTVVLFIEKLKNQKMRAIPGANLVSSGPNPYQSLFPSFFS